jgi:hypothetical protein
MRIPRNSTYRVRYVTPDGRSHHINYVASPGLTKQQGQDEAYEWAWRHDDMTGIYVDHQGGQW